MTTKCKSVKLTRASKRDVFATIHVSSLKTAAHRRLEALEHGESVVLIVRGERGQKAYFGHATRGSSGAIRDIYLNDRELGYRLPKFREGEDLGTLDVICVGYTVWLPLEPHLWVSS